MNNDELCCIQETSSLSYLKQFYRITIISMKFNLFVICLENESRMKPNGVRSRESVGKL